MKEEKKCRFALVEKITGVKFRGFSEEKCNCVWAKRLTHDLYKRYFKQLTSILAKKWKVDHKNVIHSTSNSFTVTWREKGCDLKW